MSAAIVAIRGTEKRLDDRIGHDAIWIRRIGETWVAPRNPDIGISRRCRRRIVHPQNAVPEWLLFDEGQDTHHPTLRLGGNAVVVVAKADREGIMHVVIVVDADHELLNVVAAANAA